VRLHRYFLAYFKPFLKQQWENRPLSSQGVSVRIDPRKIEYTEADLRFVTATISLSKTPLCDGDGAVLIPDSERILCEEVGIRLINVISVLEVCSKYIASPSECVALEAEGQDEMDYLTASNGIKTVRKIDQEPEQRTEWTPEVSEALAGRFDGVAVLSEALSASDDAGLYRDLARFLELAFGLSFYDKRLAKKLTQFLPPAFDYQRSEIDEWVRLRHPSVHADFKQEEWIALSTDLQHVTFRMKQACLDVLFNKSKWRDASSERRSVWMPQAISVGAAGHP